VVVSSGVFSDEVDRGPLLVNGVGSGVISRCVGSPRIVTLRGAVLSLWLLALGLGVARLGALGTLVCPGAISLDTTFCGAEAVEKFDLVALAFAFRFACLLGPRLLLLPLLEARLDR
jgi:hypothetical protein